MDFITGLPVSDGFDANMVVERKFSKRAKYIATYTNATAEDATVLFSDRVVSVNGPLG